MNTQNTTPEAPDGAPTDRRPLGYWLRVVDGLLTSEFANAFAGEHTDRRDWMLLNALSGDVELPGFAAAFARRGKRLRALAERGWISEQDGEWALTDEGREAKARLGALVDGVRARVSAAVPPEDLATTMASLEAIARELGWDESAVGGRGRGFGPGRRFGRGFGHGHRLPGFHGRPGFGAGEDPGFGRAVDSDAHCHPHHGRHHGRGERRGSEQAYERGFDAGFARGRTADAAAS